MSAPIFKKKRVIKIALEITKGTQVAGTLPMRVFELEIKDTRPFEKRSGIGLSTGNNNPGCHGEDSGECTFKALVRGNGAADLDSALQVIVQGCGFKKTGSSYQISSAHTDHESLSIDVWEDGKKKTLFGAMGELKLSGTVGDKMIIDCTFIGKYAAETDQAMPAFTPGTQTPMRLKSGTFTIGGSALLIGDYELAMNNAATLRPDASDDTGILSAAIPDADPMVNINPEDQLVGDYDFDGLLKAGTTAAIVMTANDGTDSLTISTPSVQAVEKTPSERDGIATLDWSGQAIHSVTGDDAVVISVA